MESEILDVKWCPTSNVLAVALRDGSVLLIDPDGRILDRFEGRTAANVLAWSPDGKTFAAGMDHAIICVWDLAERRRRAVLEGHTRWICGIWFLARWHCTWHLGR